MSKLPLVQVPKKNSKVFSIADSVGEEVLIL